MGWSGTAGTVANLEGEPNASLALLREMSIGKGHHSWKHELADRKLVRQRKRAFRDRATDHTDCAIYEVRQVRNGGYKARSFIEYSISGVFGKAHFPSDHDLAYGGRHNASVRGYLNVRDRGT
jgi:hypothetical protein